MKFKHLLLIILVLSTLVLLFSCGEILTKGVKKYTVTFDSNGGTSVEAQVVEENKRASAPNDPTKEGYTFLGWYVGDEKWSFLDNSVKDNLTLTAKWEIDENQIKAKMQNFSQRAAVKVTHTYKENCEEKSREGIGLVISNAGGYCYVVTNYHTVNLYENQSDSKITVTDFYGNQFNAEVFEGKYKESPAMDSEYDLAAICFPYRKSDIQGYGRAGAQCNIGESVFAMGVSNETIAMGEIIDIAKADLNCEVYHHSAVAENITKESFLFNLELQLVGITYHTENGVAYTISMDKVQDFLNNYVYE